MKKQIIVFQIIFFVNMTVHFAFAQDSSQSHIRYPAGISVEYSLGQYAVRDEYISKEKYSGTMHGIQVGWARFHKKYVYHLSLDYANSSEIENYNVSTDIYRFTLNQGFLYPLRKRSLFSKDVHIFLGPATELYFFYNNPDVAVSGFDYAQSFAALFSLTMNSQFIIPLSGNLQFESALSFSLLSLGFRMVDSEEEDTSPAKLLTLFVGTHLVFQPGIRYYMLDALSLKVSYKFDMTRISSWDPLYSAGDYAAATLSWHF